MPRGKSVIDISTVKTEKINIDYNVNPNKATSGPHPTLTEEQKKNLIPIKDDTIFVDQFGRPAIAVYHGAINKRLWSSLESSAKLVKKHTKASTKRKETRHIGWWCRYKKDSPLHRSTETALVRRILRKKLRPRYTLFWKVRANRIIFGLVDKYLRATDKILYKAYCGIKTPRKRLLGKSYLMCALNFHVSSPHFDCKDEIEGLCCVIPFGDFSGGDLVFRQHNLRFELKAGDMIFFRSRELLHENLEAQGDRMSIVFTMDHNAFLSPGQKVTRQYFSKPYLCIDRDPDDSEEEANEDIQFANTSDDELANEEYGPSSSWKIKKRRNKRHVQPINLTASKVNSDSSSDYDSMASIDDYSVYE